MYQWPVELGQFDYAFFGSILLHLQNPVQALISFAQATREKVIVTDGYENIGHAADGRIQWSQSDNRRLKEEQQARRYGYAGSRAQARRASRSTCGRRERGLFSP